MNGTYKNWYNCIYVLENVLHIFAHEPLEKLVTSVLHIASVWHGRMIMIVKWMPLTL